MTKKHIRQEILRWRKTISHERVEKAAHYGASHIRTLPQYKNAKMIAAYAEIRGEFPCLALAKQWRQEGKIICLPVMETDATTLKFYTYDLSDPLQKNSVGVFEPSAQSGQPICLSEIDIMFIPLVACDTAGHRIGYGKGFYDSTLASVRHGRPYRIGLAYSEQVLPAIPTDPWDVPLQAILTDDRFILCEKGM